MGGYDCWVPYKEMMIDVDSSTLLLVKVPNYHWSFVSSLGTSCLRFLGCIDGQWTNGSFKTVYGIARYISHKDITILMLSQWNFVWVYSHEPFITPESPAGCRSSNRRQIEAVKQITNRLFNYSVKIYFVVACKILNMCYFTSLFLWEDWHSGKV